MSEIAGKGGMTAGLLLAGTVTVLALPSAVLAFSTRFATVPHDAPVAEALQSDRADRGPIRLARAIPLRSWSGSQLFPFTPAKTPNQADRSITVAVRLDPRSAQTIAVFARKPAVLAENDTPSIGIAPTAFTLGVSRGYRNFTQDLTAPADGRSKGELPDLGKYSITTAGAGSSRLSPRIVLDDRPAAGRAPRTFAGDREDHVDLGGSYRLTRNLNVTAGVRYAEERDRLMPLTDGGQDSQAVYVGTQFRF